MVADKDLMARNIKRFMEEKGVNATEICSTLGFKHNTFSDWINGKAYPRIDKIEMMANYFGVTKADLVEDKELIIKRAREMALIEAYQRGAKGSDILNKLFSLPQDIQDFLIKQIEFAYDQQMQRQDASRS